MAHRNAPLTPEGRRRLCQRVDAGRPICHVAAEVPAYVEHHRTMGDRIRELVAAGFVVLDVIEPQWPEGFDRVWGQWSPLCGEYFPGTAIFVSRLG